MKIHFELRWRTDDKRCTEIDPRLLALLKAVRDRGSLTRAAKACGVSYRFAWELFRSWQKNFAVPLVVLERGRGASLTELGEKLLHAEQRLLQRLAPELAGLEEELNQELARSLQPGRHAAKIRLHASHDLAILQLEEPLRKSLPVDLQFRGSLESLRHLLAGQCDVAGFHFPLGKLAGDLKKHYQDWLVDTNVKLLQLAVREQGLILAPGNPRRITRLEHLARRSVRFINRQKESGTRTIFDALLKLERIQPARIKGYYDEEFTHLAVAAMVASGIADAGFGIRAAASKFGLDFVPVIEENYVLAINHALNSRVLDTFTVLLNDPSYRKQVDSLPGYSARNTGKILSAASLLSGK